MVRAAENDIVDAVRTKQYYTLIQLQDLVRDYLIGGVKGQQIMSLIADLAWSHAVNRKRYPKGTPQGDDPSGERGQDRLQQLKTGARIFILEGVQQTDGLGNVIGVYGGQEKPNAGLVAGSMIKGGIGHPVPLWGENRKHDFEAEQDPFY